MTSKVGVTAVLHANPEDLQNPVGLIEGIVNQAEVVATIDKRTGIERIVRVGVLDVLIATHNFPRPDGVFGRHREDRVVGDLADKHSRGKAKLAAEI